MTRTSEAEAETENASRKPRDEEIDVYGLTHTGLVRKTNQDHFLIGSLRKKLDVRLASLPAEDLPHDDQRVAFLAMVADGVGGGYKGEEASRIALEEVTQYITESARCYFAGDAVEEDFIASLKDAAALCHKRVMDRAAGDPDASGMATTLTLWLGVWPWIYLLQVGDSRYYVYNKGELRQITRDQTMAQELADTGVMAKAVAFSSRWAHVLSSSIGGPQTAPVITRLKNSWDNVHLICSDGLTKHVSDERIRERLRTMTSAQQVCEALLQDALDGGGTDNVTVIVGWAPPKS